MPLGVIINSFSIFLGGIAGGLLGHLLPERFKTEIQLIFGLCAMAMGIPAVNGTVHLPAVILAVILGTSIGMAVHLEHRINRAAEWMQRPISNLFPKEQLALSHNEFVHRLVTIIVLFCASGTGIYGSLDAGMTGDHTVLIAKSVLDFFTAAIFACNLGYVVSMIAVPQFFIFLSLFLLAGIIFPLTTPEMVADFKSCGGILIIATSFRMIQVKQFPTADMIPAMVLVMPISWFWMTIILPLL
ncbi:membrane protein [Enterococcus florum]|uniref:Membrane protein n=1 Tax=Enterococcus florum TaxID=2480627 RepID=A0A4P5PDD5_9ENTE|nr:DUF554 domain-containing protein [Enterococcus florum]GCF94038.1 membrane protein [Enterococcus florum]